MAETHTPPSPPSKTPEKPGTPPDKPGTPPTPGPGGTQPKSGTDSQTPSATAGPSPRAGSQTTAVPFLVYQVNNATHALPQILRMPELAGVTVNAGTPVLIGSGLNAGFLMESPAIAGPTNVIAGFTTEFGHNLTANGTAPVGGSGLYFGSVPNQVNARNIAIGSPMADGNLGINVATDQTIFQGKTDAGHALLSSDIGAVFGLTKDATTRNWFVDTTITTAVTGACVQVVALVDPLNTVGGRVAFRVMRQYQQLFV